MRILPKKSPKTHYKPKTPSMSYKDYSGLRGFVGFYFVFFVFLLFSYLSGDIHAPFTLKSLKTLFFFFLLFSHLLLSSTTQH